MLSRRRSYSDIFASGPLYGLNRLVDSSIFSEDGQEFKVHKWILSKESDYFCARFKYNLGNKTVTLEFGSKILENILLFLYTGEAFLDEDNIADMMIAADYLLINSLLVHCRSFAIQNISLRCCIPLLAAAWIVERLGIVKECYRYVQMNFGSLVHINNSHISELPFNCLKKLLEDDSLGVNDEETAWIAINIWIEEDTLDREQYFPELLFCLRLSNGSLLSDITNSDLVKVNSLCKSLGEEKWDQLLSLLSTMSLEILLQSERCPRKMYLCLRSMPFPLSNSKQDVFISYDGELDIWRKVGETRANFETLIPINQKIYMFNSSSNASQVFDLKLKTWHQPDHIRTALRSYSIAQSKDRIYAIGGSVLMSQLKYYRPSTDMWHFKLSLSSVNISGSVVVDDKLYVIGYKNGAMKAWIYDTSDEHLCDIEKPRVFRVQFAIVSFNERVYILGGRTEENNIITSVEVYNPVQNKWDIFTDLAFPYAVPQAVILEEKLMIYEDFREGRLPKFPPSVLNEEIQSWEIVCISSPLRDIHRYRFCVIDDQMILSNLMKENKNTATEWESFRRCLNPYRN